MTRWPLKSVAELCSRVTSGGTPSRAKPEFYDPGVHFWVKSKELLDRAIVDTEESISDEGLKGSSAKYVKPCSVLMAMYGANVGQLGWLSVPATVNQAICAMETEPGTTDGRWLYYSLMRWRPSLTAKAHGAAQQNLSQGLIREFSLPTPPLRVQRKIAAVLSAYDELIENNLRRIEILEEMAQAVYREWFVNFRFPGHEDVALVDSPLGSIPEGWDVRTIGEIGLGTNGVVGGPFGSKLGRKDYADSGIPVIRGTNLNGLIGFNYDDFVFVSEDKFDDLRGNAAAPGDIIVTQRGTMGQVGLIPQSSPYHRYVVSQSQMRITVDPTIATPLFLYQTLNWPTANRRLVDHVMSSGVPHINLGILRGFKVVVPRHETMARFDQAVRPGRQMMENLMHQNFNLRTTRDLLLPRLLSGDLDVSDLDIDTEWLAS